VMAAMWLDEEVPHMRSAASATLESQRSELAAAVPSSWQVLIAMPETIPIVNASPMSVEHREVCRVDPQPAGKHEPAYWIGIYKYVHQLGSSDLARPP